jgi:hypothetical protein
MIAAGEVEVVEARSVADPSKWASYVRLGSWVGRDGREVYVSARRLAFSYPSH